jgi:DNA-binding NarL/FixJ family response regulator
LITLLIADDHPLVRDALTQLLRGVEDFTVLAAVRDGREAVATTLKMSPDVVLMDLEMPELNGIEATRALNQARSQAHIVVLTSFADRDSILAALDAGALGYLLKDAEPEEIIRGVRAAASGDSPLALRAATQLVADRATMSSGPAFSARERDVLALLVQGLPNKLIARELDISEKTVKAHLTSVFAQIGVTDRTQAALWAQRRKIV